MGVLTWILSQLLKYLNVANPALMDIFFFPPPEGSATSCQEVS